MMPKWCHERFLLVVAYRRSFFGSGLLELYRTSPWLCCKKHCFPGENAHLSEMPRCLVATVLSLFSSRTDADVDAFWRSKVASKWHLHAPGNGMDRSIDFGMHSVAILPTTWAPLGSIWASLGPHWAPSWPPRPPVGNFSSSLRSCFRFVTPASCFFRFDMHF